jgi:hypothetical protein
LNIKQLGQSVPGGHRDRGDLGVDLTCAHALVQHPGGQRALGLIGQLDDDFVRAKAVAPSNDSDFLATEGMKTVVDAVGG